MIAFFEGSDGWTPQIGQVFYKAEGPRVEVWTGLNIVDEASGNVSCCDDGKVIGRIANGKFN